MTMPKTISEDAAAVVGEILDRFTADIDQKIATLSVASYSNSNGALMDAKVKAYVKSKQVLNEVIAEVTGIKAEP